MKRTHFLVWPVWTLAHKPHISAKGLLSTWSKIAHDSRTPLHFAGQSNRHTWRGHQQWKPRKDCPQFRSWLIGHSPRSCRLACQRGCGQRRLATRRIPHRKLFEWCWVVCWYMSPWVRRLIWYVWLVHGLHSWASSKIWAGWKIVWFLCTTSLYEI
jgi:hypothetical protein